MERSSELELRDKDDIWHHWIEKMCNKFKNPTGTTDRSNNFILSCQRVQLVILKKNEATLMGVHSESSSDNGEKDEDDKDNDLDGVEDAHLEEEKQDEAAVVPALPTLNVTPPFDVAVPLDLNQIKRLMV
jgi:hypothetical protein